MVAEAGGLSRRPLYIGQGPGTSSCVRQEPRAGVDVVTLASRGTTLAVRCHVEKWRPGGRRQVSVRMPWASLNKGFTLNRRNLSRDVLFNIAKSSEITRLIQWLGNVTTDPRSILSPLRHSLWLALPADCFSSSPEDDCNSSQSDIADRANTRQKGAVSSSISFLARKTFPEALQQTISHPTNPDWVTSPFQNQSLSREYNCMFGLEE